LLIVFILGLAVDSHAAPQKGELMFAGSLKEKICKVASSDYGRQGVLMSGCVNQQFTFSEDARSVSIGGQPDLTTLMDIAFSSGGVDFSVQLVAVLEVTETGAIKRVDWSVVNLNPVNFSDDKILENSWYGEHVQAFDSNELDPGLVNKIAEVTEGEVLASADEFSSESDFEMRDVAGEEWEVIKHPESGKTLGYIVPGWASSESADIKMSVAVKVNTLGDLVDYSVESWGYHE
jgi:hypothetical protein